LLCLVTRYVVHHNRGAAARKIHAVQTPDTSARTRHDRDATVEAHSKHLEALRDQAVAFPGVSDLLRACGQNPTLKEIRDLQGSIGQDFDFDTFSKVLNRPGGFTEPLPVEDYMAGFAAFDREGTGIIPWGQAKYVLQSVGEPMSEDEVNELARTMGIDPDKGGEVNLADMVTKIISN